MKNSIWVAILGGAMISAMPMGATTTTFNFTDGLNGTYGNGVVTTACSGGVNSQCSNNADLSQYAVTPSGQTGTAVTATAFAFYVTGNSSGPTSTLTTGEVGEYTGDGLGICENQTGVDCTQPNHQINNGTNSTGSYDYEFMLIQFSAAVNLSSIQLANFGGGASDPFIASYYTSTSTATNLGTALAGTSLSSLGNSFSGLQATTCAGCTASSTPDETVNGNGITYLLIGASIASGQSGDDFFKIQDIDASKVVSPTPEPATFGLIGLALTGLGIYGRKRQLVKN